MKSIFLISALSLLAVSAIGVGVGLQANNKAEEVRAEAATWAAGKTIYIRNSCNAYQSDARLFLNYQDGENGWHQEELLSTSTITTKGDETLLTYSLTYSCKHIQIHRTNSGGLDGEGHQDWHWSSSVDIQSDTHNLFVYDNCMNNDTGFGALSVGIVKVELTQPANGTVSVKNHNGEQSGEGYYYSDWELDFSASAEAPYYFNYWTYKSGELFLPFEGEDRSYNPNTMTNLEGLYHLSAMIGDSSADCNTFQNTFLHMNDSNYDAIDAGLCDKVPEGEEKDRYNLAKDAYNALHSASKAYFSSQAAYADARARLSAWATAHGESFTVTDGVGSFSAYVPSTTTIETQASDMTLIIVLASIVTVAAFGGYFLLRKRKED